MAFIARKDDIFVLLRLIEWVCSNFLYGWGGKILMETGMLLICLINGKFEDS